VDRAGFEETLQTNAVAPLFLTQALLPALRAGSRVLHISSGAAQRPFPSWGAYCASKAALHMLYGVLAAELGASGVAFGSVRPGVVDTPMQDRIREEGAGVPAFTDHARFVALREGMGAPSAAASAAAATHPLKQRHESLVVLEGGHARALLPNAALHGRVHHARARGAHRHAAAAQLRRQHGVQRVQRGL
jgi:NAD(P)-dependent dehydrogenase (short-subunit alcohol dehydrogenase family)